MTNRTLTSDSEVLKSHREISTSVSSNYHGFRNIFENFKRTRLIWTFTTLLALAAGPLFAQTPVELYRQNLERQKQLSQTQYQQGQYQRVPTQYQQTQKRPISAAASSQINSQNRNAIMQSGSAASSENTLNQRQYRTVPSSNNNRQPVLYRTVPQQSVRSSSNNFQQKMLRQSPAARSARSPQFTNNQALETQRRYYQNGTSPLPANNSYHSQNSYPNGYPNNYALNASGRPQQPQTQQPGRMSRMKFSLSNSTQSAMATEQTSVAAAQNASTSKSSSSGPSAGSVWTAFLTGKYSPELVQWYVNRYQDQTPNANSRHHFDLYNAEQNAGMQSGGELSMAGANYDQYRENPLANYARRNPEVYAAGNSALNRASDNNYRQLSASPSQNPYYADALRQNPHSLAPNYSVNTPQGIPLNYSTQAYANGMNSPKSEGAEERTIPNTRFSTVRNVPLAERNHYQSSLSNLFKKKEKSPSFSNEQLLAIQRYELQRQQWEYQQHQWELRQLEDQRVMEYQRQLAVNSSPRQDPQSYSPNESYNNSPYYEESLANENNRNSGESQQTAAVNRKKDFVKRWSEIAARQEELAREQQWLAEQKDLLARENPKLAPSASSEIQPPRPLVDQQLAYSQNDRNPEQSANNLPANNYNNSYAEMNAPIQQVSGSVPYYQMPQTQSRSYSSHYEPIPQNSSSRTPAAALPKKNSGTNVFYPKGDFIQ